MAKYDVTAECKSEVPPSLHIISLTLRTVSHLSPHSASCQRKLPCGVVVNPTRGRCECFEVNSWCRFHLCFPRCRFHDSPLPLYSILQYVLQLTPLPYRLPCRYCDCHRDTSTYSMFFRFNTLPLRSRQQPHLTSPVPSFYMAPMRIIRIQMVARENGRDRRQRCWSGNPNLSGWRNESAVVSIVGCREVRRRVERRRWYSVTYLRDG